jgi:hypothetical protein
LLRLTQAAAGATPGAADTVAAVDMPLQRRIPVAGAADTSLRQLTTAAAHARMAAR